MSRTKRYALFSLGVVSALGIAWLVRQRREEISGLRVWQQLLIKRHGPEKAHQLATSIQREFVALAAEHPLPTNPALRWHLQKNILPGLALYRVLLQEYGGNQQAALAEADEAFRVWTLAKNRLLLAPLKRVPASFRLFRLAFTQMMKRFPTEGWDFEFVEDSADRIAFNATRCFYLNTLTAYGAPELTASFCKIDEVMAELFPPSVRFVRLHTLGRGDQVCDFQYCRAEKR